MGESAACRQSIGCCLGEESFAFGECIQVKHAYDDDTPVLSSTITELH